MIEKSLFYQHGRRPYILESLSTTDERFYITRGRNPNALMLAKDITKIGGVKPVIDFIYKNYEEHKTALNAAAMYEFSEIYRALKNISIEVEKIPTYYTNSSKDIEVNLNGYIKVNKEYYEDMKGIIFFIKNDDYSDLSTIDATQAKTEGKDKVIDIFESFKKELSVNALDKESKNNYSILIDSGATSVKYKLDIHYDRHTELIGNQMIEKINYYLNDIELLPLTSQDLELLQLQG